MFRTARLATALGAAAALVLLSGGVAAATSPLGAAAARPGPAAPVELAAANSTSAIHLSWRQPRVGAPAVSFRVYEGGTVVARHTSTSLWMSNLGFGATHTYTVTAVDRQGRESAHSAPVTRTVWQGGANPACFSPPEVPIVATEVTSSAVSLAWQPADWPLPVLLLQGDTPVLTEGTGARVGGLAPATAYTFVLTTHDCHQQQRHLGSVTVTTLAGPARRPAAPTAAVLAGATATSVTLRWDRPADGSAVRYAVYDRGTRVATTGSTSVTVRRLYHAQWYGFTVAALDAAGNESTHTPLLRAQTATCPVGDHRPVAVRAVPVSASTVRLSWVQPSLASSFTVYDGSAVVATTSTAAAVLTGLASDSRHTYRVRATLIDDCGQTGPSSSVSVRTAAGPAARPSTPTALSAVVRPLTGNSSATVAVTWKQPASADPVVGYQLYEDAVVVATTTVPTVDLTVRTNTRHTYTVTAVDAAGNESTGSAPATVQVPYLPLP